MHILWINFATWLYRNSRWGSRKLFFFALYFFVLFIWISLWIKCYDNLVVLNSIWYLVIYNTPHVLVHKITAQCWPFPYVLFILALYPSILKILNFLVVVFLIIGVKIKLELQMKYHLLMSKGTVQSNP